MEQWTRPDGDVMVGEGAAERQVEMWELVFSKAELPSNASAKPTVHEYSPGNCEHSTECDFSPAPH